MPPSLGKIRLNFELVQYVKYEEKKSLEFKNRIKKFR